MRAAIRVLANIGTSPLGAWAGWSDTRPLADATIAHDTRIEREVAHAGEIIRRLRAGRGAIEDRSSPASRATLAHHPLPQAGEGKAPLRLARDTQGESFV